MPGCELGSTGREKKKLCSYDLGRLRKMHQTECATWNESHFCRIINCKQPTNGILFVR